MREVSAISEPGKDEGVNKTRTPGVKWLSLWTSVELGSEDAAHQLRETTKLFTNGQIARKAKGREKEDSEGR